MRHAFTFDIPGFLGSFGDLLRQHLTMALVSALLGLAISLPLGLLCVRWRRLYPPVLALASILYSIPSLAFFVLLIASTGLTEKTVIIPLTVYTLAVLVPNIVDGLRSIPEDVRQAAIAMGFSAPRRLLQVDLPLALPAVMAGLRVVVVSNISMVSVGALIGVGAFGALFTAAAQFQRTDYAWTGIVVSVAMALVADLVLIAIGWLLTPWTRKKAGRA